MNRCPFIHIRLSLAESRSSATVVAGLHRFLVPLLPKTHLGPVIVLGPLVGGLVGALGGSVVVGGLSALGAGLYSIGIPQDSIVAYETALKSAQFLVMAHGTDEEVATATRILETTGAAYIAAHQGVFVAALNQTGPGREC